MVLTSHGRDLLSKGELRFIYWMPFDDEIDYEPPLVSSGSLTADQLRELRHLSIEDEPIREATAGYRKFDRSGSDTTNVNRPLFTVPQGQRVLPRMSASNFPDGGVVLEVKQQKLVDLQIVKDKDGRIIQQLGPFDRGYRLFDASSFTLDLTYAKDSFPPDHRTDGFALKIYRSGTEGWRQVDQRRDAENEIAFENDLRFMTVQRDRNSGR